MTPWIELNEQNLAAIPDNILGVFQLSRNANDIIYVGRSDLNIKEALKEFIGKNYTHFQWTQVPWEKEAFEMNCRLFHHAGGMKKLDNADHPYPPEGKFWKCTLSSQPPAMCEL